MCSDVTVEKIQKKETCFDIVFEVDAGSPPRRLRSPREAVIVWGKVLVHWRRIENMLVKANHV